MVCTAAGMAEGVVLIVATIAMATLQVFQAQHVVGGLGGGRWRQGCRGGGRPDVSQESTNA
jgi:hypothetical protein